MSKHLSSFCLPTLGLLLLLQLPASQGFYRFQEQIPNGNNVPHPCKANYRWPGVGHKNTNGGGERNVFGQDFENVGQFMWNRALCEMDSDGDGKTNGEELGDPNCMWRSGELPERTTDISHPGICEPYGSEQCRGRDLYVDCELEQMETCDIIKDAATSSIDLRFLETVVPNTETNYYCMTFDLPADQDYHILANEPIMDNLNVLHHMLLYGCAENSSSVDIQRPEACGMTAETGDCGNIISGWTVGQSGQCWGGDNVGFRFGLNGFKKVRLEIHWNNPQLVTDYTDSSGLRLYYQPARTDIQDLTTLVVGQRYLTIPPGRSRVEQVGTCPSECSKFLIKKEVYVYSALNHMHYLGQSQKIEAFRNGVKVADITNDEYYSYDSPVDHMHDPPIVLQPGDEIRTTCVFNSLSSKRYVYYGDGTSNEMCFGFLTVYPADALDFTYCVALGNVSVCEAYGGQPIDGCELESFLDSEHISSRDMYTRLEENCNLDGFCRPECLAVVDMIKRHPCMSGRAKHIVHDYLTSNQKGLSFLGRVHSCGQGVDHDESEDCASKCADWCYPDVRDGAELGQKVGVVVFSLSLLASVL